MNDPTVHVYIQDTCFHCHDQINWMTEQGYTFITKDISTEENQETFLQLGGRGTPFTVVTKKDGSHETVTGFQKKFLKMFLQTVM